MFKNRFFNTIIILIVIGLVLLIVSAKNRTNIAVLDNIVMFLYMPLANTCSSVADSTSSFFTYFQSKPKLVLENQKLTEKANKLEFETEQYKALSLENERLRKLLDLENKNPKRAYVPAKVTLKDNGAYYKMFVVNKGKNSGVDINMPVVNELGLIGYTVEVGPDFAKVQTIIDSSSSAGCIVVRTGEMAVTEGDITLMQDALLKMVYVSKDMNIAQGDLIETSGLGKIYPDGILIGRVKDIKKDSYTQMQYGVIQPAVDFKTIKEVMIITSK